MPYLIKGKGPIAGFMKVFSPKKHLFLSYTVNIIFVFTEAAACLYVDRRLDIGEWKARERPLTHETEWVVDGLVCASELSFLDRCGGNSQYSYRYGTLQLRFGTVFR